MWVCVGHCVCVYVCGCAAGGIFFFCKIELFPNSIWWTFEHSPSWYFFSCLLSFSVRIAFFFFFGVCVALCIPVLLQVALVFWVFPPFSSCSTCSNVHNNGKKKKKKKKKKSFVKRSTQVFFLSKPTRNFGFSNGVAKSYRRGPPPSILEYHLGKVCGKNHLTTSRFY